MPGKLGVVIGVVAMVLAIVAVIGPWWVMDTSASVGPLSMTGHSELGLFGGFGSFQMGSTSSSNTTNYNDAPHVGSVFTLATVLLILGLIIGVGMVVVGAMSGANPSLKRLGGVLGILAFLVVLVSTLYVMSSLPDAVNQDSGVAASGTTVSGFWGSKTTTVGSFAQATVTWAAGWGWYLALVAAVVFLVAGVVLLLSRTPKMAMAPPMPPSP